MLASVSRSSLRILNSALVKSNVRFTSVAKTPVKPILEGWKQKFQESEVDSIDYNLKVIVAHVLKTKFNLLDDSFNNVHFSEEEAKDFDRLCEARCARMPLQHIIGEWDFLNITLKTAPTVFIPRPETEYFVEGVIDYYRNEKDGLNMLEVGCGSGAMSLAILNDLPHVHSTAIERSRAATALAWENAKLLKLDDRFKVFNHTMEEHNYLPEELTGKTYDFIISNPPYVRTNEFQYLKPEVVVYENVNALDGGPDGLRVARLVLDLACVHLRPAGRLWLELGNDHPPLIKTIIHLKYEDKLKYVSTFEDQYQRERFVIIERL